jgi:hypothetical protein
MDNLCLECAKKALQKCPMPNLIRFAKVGNLVGTIGTNGAGILIGMEC